MKKILILIGVIVGTFVLWAAVGFVASDQLGKVGYGGSLLLGFAIVPIVIRITIAKLFKAGSKKLEP